MKTHAVNLALAAATALMIWLAFPPVDFGLIAWVALVPWLAMVSRATPGRAALWSLIAGYGLFVALLHWIRFVTPAGWLALALYCALYWPLAAWILGGLRRRGIPLYVTAPLTVTTLEFARASLFTGFPFLFLSHTQYKYLPIIQIGDLTGAYGVTFLIALVNGALAELALSRFAPSKRTLIPLGAAALLVAAALGYGFNRLAALNPRPGPRVLMVQGNVPQDLKHSSSLEDGLELMRRHVRLSQAVTPRPDLVIWSETMFPAPVNVAYDKDFIAALTASSKPEVQRYGLYLAQCRAELEKAAAQNGAPMLVGAEAYFGKPKRRYNSVFHLSPQAQILDRYDKIHLVVFGEYVPLADIFPFLKPLRPEDLLGPDNDPGWRKTIFKLPTQNDGTMRFGTTICYEDAEADLFRLFVRDGAQFMVNVTNDGWFRDSSELDVHLAVCAWRAVENRVPVARCANTGISAIIAPDGRIAQRLVGPDGRDREVEGTLVGTLQTTRLKSFYSAHGNLFADACALGMAGTIVFVLVRRKKD